MTSGNPQAWDRVVGFFDGERSTTAQVYPSEWFFLKDLLKDGVSVLDMGCAQGGFASILEENLKGFHYTGADISAEMLARARARHPGHRFVQIAEGDDSALGDGSFDLVLVLGILHLHEAWRDTIAQAWKRTANVLLLDLRETDGPTIEDKALSWFRMDFGGGDGSASLPYIIVNAGEALATIRRLCPGARRISRFGYTHPVSASAVTPCPEVLSDVWCIER